jgi:hypothetical protein
MCDNDWWIEAAVVPRAVIMESSDGIVPVNVLLTSAKLL